MVDHLPADVPTETDQPDLVVIRTTGKEGRLYGDGPRGLTQEHVERILALLRK
jgi:hypothetical protein